MGRKASAQPSEKGLEVVEFIVRHVEEFGFQPTQQEMAEHFGVTTTAIQNRLNELKKRGIIEEEQRERAVRIRFLRFRAVPGEA